MPMRTRLILLIGMVLLVCLACGGALIGWHAANSVRNELRAAVDVGAKIVRNELDELAHSDDGASALRHLVNTFDGNRHVRATFMDAGDRRVAVSEPLVPTQPAPDWFRALIDGGPAEVRVAIPRNGGSILLQTDSNNEISEVWGESRDAALVLTGFAVLTTAVICVVIGRISRPLENLANAFGQIGEGNYHGTVSERGPPELSRLAIGFNVMTRRLAVAAAQNRRLNERLLTLQAEERADLARDLHDEIGPLLFAVEMTSATIERLAGSGRETDIPAHVHSIQEAVARVQRHVRVLLGRLRPITAAGLEVAIDQLTAFWRSRRPDITFSVSVSVEEDEIDDDARETIYRIVQEGLSNAIRHGDPGRVEIDVARDDDGNIRVEVTDDGNGMAANGMGDRDPMHLGLVGMRERVMAMAGSLSIQNGHAGRGFSLVVGLPRTNAIQSRDMDGPV